MRTQSNAILRVSVKLSEIEKRGTYSQRVMI
jgi:hypothetical protein